MLLERKTFRLMNQALFNSVSQTWAQTNSRYSRECRPRTSSLAEQIPLKPVVRIKQSSVHKVQLKTSHRLRRKHLTPTTKDAAISVAVVLVAPSEKLCLGVFCPALGSSPSETMLPKTIISLENTRQLA